MPWSCSLSRRGWLSVLAATVAISGLPSLDISAQTPISATFQVAAGGDDANEDATWFDASGTTVWLGNGSSVSASYAGFRFTGVTIPRNATISSARLEVTAANNQWIGINLEFAVEAVGNSASFTPTTKPSQRTLETPRVLHSSNQQWIANTWYTLDEIATLIQAVVNRADWSSGNALAVIVRGRATGAWGRKFIQSQEGASARAARLLVTYSGTGGGGDTTPPTVINRSPAPTATEVGLSANVAATFSEPVVPSSIVMTLRDPSGSAVPASVTYQGTTATLDPSTVLQPGLVYTATLSGARDAAGNVMTQVSWTFTTLTLRDDVLPFTGLVDPTVVAFASDGRVYVAEKSGLIRVFDNLSDSSGTIVADLRTKVHNFWDRGLLGMTLDPSFPTAPYAYVLYAHDAAIGGTAPRWGSAGVSSDPCPSPPGATTNGCVISGRLSRINVLDASLSDETVLIENWYQQFPSHSVGSLEFGFDGSLYVSGGEGASFNYADWGQTSASPPSGDPTNQGGALRAQDLRTSGDPVTLDGAILRVDPNTGAALPDNPLFANSDPNARRIIAHGLRNPFRFTLRPGTREVWVGDVGWSTWEEINVIPDSIDGSVENFGWPCYEGTPTQNGYASLAICQGLYSAAPGTVTSPFFSYHHNDRVVPNEVCGVGSSSISGLAFYTGTDYPVELRGALFFADYSRSCIWAMLPGVGGVPDPANRLTIRSATGGPVFLTTGPAGDVFYTGLNDDRVHRLRFVSSVNQPPTAVAQASPTSGPLPLTVNFSALASTDPEGQTLTYEWDLDGDGAFDDSTSAQPSRTYTSPGNVTVGLSVRDSAGWVDTDTVVIAPSNSPPTATIASPNATFTWSVGDTIAFSGGATDPDQGTLPASALSWAIVMHHCPSTCHTHPIQTIPGVASGSFAAPDHEYPSWVELRLTATDNGGLQHTASVIVHPRTVDVTLTTSTSGLQLALGGTTATTPFTRAVIIGSTNSVGAPTPQSLSGNTYNFVSWSDGGSATHTFVAPSTPVTMTANYQQGAPSTPVTATFTIASGADDVTEEGTFYDPSGSPLWVGTGSSVTASYTGFRFTNVTIPRGATISSARLEVAASSTQWIGIALELTAEASGNSAAFSATSRPSQRTLVGPRVAHSSNVQWIAGTRYQFEEIAALIQAIVSRSDWNPGQALSVMTHGTAPGAWGRKFGHSFESSSANAVRLVVTYVP